MHIINIEDHDCRLQDKRYCTTCERLLINRAKYIAEVNQQLTQLFPISDKKKGISKSDPRE